MRISDWSSDVCSSDLAIGTIGDLNIIGAQTGERRYDLLKWRYGRKFTRHRPIRCAFKTVLHHHATSAGKLYCSCNRNRCVAVASHSTLHVPTTQKRARGLQSRPGPISKANPVQDHKPTAHTL